MTDFLTAAPRLGLGGESRFGWRALGGGAFGCQLTTEQSDFFRARTGREPLSTPCRELWLAIGRRGGKNYFSAAVVVFLALLKHWRLAPGETGTIMALASDRTQAKIMLRYVRGRLEGDPVLWQEVANVTNDSIQLRNGIEIVIGTAENAAVRGRTIVAAILDEYAFWPHEQAEEVLRAIRPGMATQPDSMLIVISSVYAAFGPFFEARKAHYGVDDPRVLYAVATTQQMNPTISEDFIAQEIARDPANMAEYLSVERSDLASFLDAELVDSVTRSSPRELPCIRTTPSGTPIARYAGLDISGARIDATAATVAHREGDVVKIDACRRWPAPHDPADVAREVTIFLAGYGLKTAFADRYGAEISRALYREAGIALIDAPDNKSDTYLKVLPLFRTGRIELPPDPTLRQELLGLERRTRSGGRDLIDHRAGQHDDLANSMALAAVAAARVPQGSLLSYSLSEQSVFMQSELGWLRNFDS